MYNQKIVGLAQQLVDHVIEQISNSGGRLPPWNIPVPGYPILVGNSVSIFKFDANNDLYVEFNVDGGSTPDAIVKFKPYPVPGNNLANPVTGANQTTFTPHVVMLGLDIGSNASGTATLSTAVATNAVTINGVAFTAVASGATGNQWNIGANDTASAANLAAAINGSVTAGAVGVFFAVAAANVVTIWSSTAGAYNNNITLTKTGAPITVSGATLTGGTSSTFSASDWLQSLLLQECSDLCTELQVYEKAGIVHTDLGTASYQVIVTRSPEWGALSLQ